MTDKLAIFVRIQADLLQYQKDMDRAARLTGSSTKDQEQIWARSVRARQVLGTRSEKEVRFEIQLTRAAYEALAASGTAGSRELSRAHDAMRQKVAALHQEIKGVSRADQSRALLGVRSEKEIQREIHKTQGAYTALAASGKASGGDLARAHDAMRQKMEALQQEIKGVSREEQSHALLGVRSEKDIQREIHKTQGAYAALSASGKLSGRELARAASAAKTKVAELRKEMAKPMPNWAGKVGPVAAGAAAAGYVLKDPINKTMTYDRRLALMANTAFAGQDFVSKKKGMGELDKAIATAVQQGGGTREGAADALDNLLASGALKPQTALNLLPTIQKMATATGADPKELGDIAIRAVQSFGIQEKDVPLALDMAVKAGQLGSFETKNMAKWLPQQMAAAKSSGMSGLSGFGKLLAANQAAAITAGTKDEAGNNLVNLLAKINSVDTAKDFKKQGINVSQELAKARLNGVDSVDAFAGLIDRMVSKDATSKKIVARMQQAKANGEDQDTVWESLKDLRDGSIIGKVLQDRQALMAFVGIRNNKEYMKGIEGKLPGATGTGQSNYDLIGDTPSFKVDQLKNEKDIAQQKALEPLNQALGSAAETATGLAREFPLVTTGAVAAGTALTALAAGLAGSSIWNVLASGKLPGAVSEAAKTTASSVIPSAGGFLSTISKMAGPLLALNSIATFGTSEEDDETLNGKSRWEKIRKTHSQEEITAARKRYQPWHQLGEGYSAENEKWLEQYRTEKLHGTLPPVPGVTQIVRPVRAGDLPPVSGIAQAIRAERAGNLPGLPDVTQAVRSVRAGDLPPVSGIAQAIRAERTGNLPVVPGVTQAVRPVRAGDLPPMPVSPFAMYGIKPASAAPQTAMERVQALISGEKVGDSIATKIRTADLSGTLNILVRAEGGAEASVNPVPGRNMKMNVGAYMAGG